jgi:hypothetical protein
MSSNFTALCSQRGRIEIVNRRGLKEAACECYDVISRAFDQILEDKQVAR